ncbi:MAG TPA: hypothetical protein VMU75_06435 [Acidimicrobiales bacterium]|nr:hypothetical protein [Acidimicrobiales bacterium]
MGSLIVALLGLRADDGGQGGGRISIGDIEEHLRSIGGNAQEIVGVSKAGAGAAAAAGAALVVAAAYLHGRRRGRRRTTVLEIRRV